MILGIIILRILISFVLSFQSVFPSHLRKVPSTLEQICRAKIVAHIHDIVNDDDDDRFFNKKEREKARNYEVSNVLRFQKLLDTLPGKQNKILHFQMKNICTFVSKTGILRSFIFLFFNLTQAKFLFFPLKEWKFLLIPLFGASVQWLPNLPKRKRAA